MQVHVCAQIMTYQVHTVEQPRDDDEEATIEAAIRRALRVQGSASPSSRGEADPQPMDGGTVLGTTASS